MLTLIDQQQKDEWGRPLFKDKQGRWYCDVYLGQGFESDIHTKDSKEGEPSYRVDEEFEIIQKS